MVEVDKERVKLMTLPFMLALDVVAQVNGLGELVTVHVRQCTIGVGAEVPDDVQKIIQGMAKELTAKSLVQASVNFMPKSEESAVGRVLEVAAGRVDARAAMELEKEPVTPVIDATQTQEILSAALGFQPSVFAFGKTLCRCVGCGIVLTEDRWRCGGCTENGDKNKMRIAHLKGEAKDAYLRAWAKLAAESAEFSALFGGAVGAGLLSTGGAAGVYALKDGGLGVLAKLDSMVLGYLDERSPGWSEPQQGE